MWVLENSSAHIERVYRMEIRQPLKIVHWLSQKALYPTNMKKVDGINALKFYEDNGLTEFHDTGNF